MKNAFVALLLVACSKPHPAAAPPPKIIVIHRVDVTPMPSDAEIKERLDSAALDRKQRHNDALAAREKQVADGLAFTASQYKEADDRRVSGVAKLGPEGREKALRSCYRAPGNCSQLAVDIYDVTAGTERQRMAALSGRLLAERAASWSSPSTDPLVCCDGSESAECVVGSKLSACCHEHGGACGYGIAAH